ncbi:hypothetical protein [Pseudomonas japonica]|uniref:hypothetical protein n=1 Tax=Pseudomonas japonica TaxID=256466 RepID=UPI0015E32DA2|nr:hypothetical protein [Pseudomonas japonica]MBA1241193.1 hypothetical protein [Pseudomonas japonica]
MPDVLIPEEIRIKSFLSAPLILLIAPWGNALYWGLWIIIAGFNAAWILNLIYRNESYTAYISTFLGYLVLIPTHLSIAMFYIWLDQDPSLRANTSYLLILVPPIIVFGFMGWTLTRPTTSSPFYCKDGKAHIFDYAEPPSTRNQILSVLAFIAGATVIENIGGATAWLLMSGVMLACALYIIYQGRHFIAGLRDLIKEERSASMRYTFLQIEEIREARSRWWISRFARWVKNLFSSRPSP